MSALAVIGTAQARERIDAVGELLAANGVQLCGRFPINMPNTEGAVLVNLVMVVAPLGQGERQTAASHDRVMVAGALGRNYQSRHSQSHCQIVDLKIGPALLAVTSGEFRFPADVTVSGELELVPQVKVEFQVPTPDCRHLIVMVTSTAVPEATLPMVTAATRIADSIQIAEGRDGSR